VTSDDCLLRTHAGLKHKRCPPSFGHRARFVFSDTASLSLRTQVAIPDANLGRKYCEKEFSSLRWQSFSALKPDFVLGKRLGASNATTVESGDFLRQNRVSTSVSFQGHVWTSCSSTRVAALIEIDQDAEFARLLHENHRELFGFILAMLQNRADAEDVYQQSVVVLWKKFSTFSPGTKFIAWAIQVAKFEIRDFVKASRRRKRHFSDAILDMIAVTYQNDASERRKERLDALACCLEKLAERDRRLLEQCYAADRDYRQIAAAEGKTIAAIYKAVSRIRRSLYLCVQHAMATE
jgi:RNA polymerase sigma-70 factor, ECF subfamily